MSKLKLHYCPTVRAWQVEEAMLWLGSASALWDSPDWNLAREMFPGRDDWLLDITDDEIREEVKGLLHHDAKSE